MGLVQVDIVGLQPLQAFVDRLENLPAAQIRRLLVVAQPGEIAARSTATAGDLGGDDDLRDLKSISASNAITRFPERKRFNYSIAGTEQP